MLSLIARLFAAEKAEPSKPAVEPLEGRELFSVAYDVPDDWCGTKPKPFPWPPQTEITMVSRINVVSPVISFDRLAGGGVPG